MEGSGLNSSLPPPQIWWRIGATKKEEGKKSGTQKKPIWCRWVRSRQGGWAFPAGSGDLSLARGLGWEAAVEAQEVREEDEGVEPAAEHRRGVAVRQVPAGAPVAEWRKAPNPRMTGILGHGNSAGWSKERSKSWGGVSVRFSVENK